MNFSNITDITNITLSDVNYYDTTDINIIQQYGLNISSQIIYILYILIITYLALEVLFIISQIFKNEESYEWYKVLKKTYYNILIVPFMIILSYILVADNILGEYNIYIFKYIFWIITITVVMLSWKKIKKATFKYIKE